MHQKQNTKHIHVALARCETATLTWTVQDICFLLL